MVATSLPFLEQRGEVDGAFTGDHVDLVFAGVIVDAHLANVVRSECIQEAGPPFGNQMSVGDVEGPFEMGGFYFIEEPAGLLNVVRDVVHL